MFHDLDSEYCFRISCVTLEFIIYHKHVDRNHQTLKRNCLKIYYMYLDIKKTARFYDCIYIHRICFYYLSYRTKRLKDAKKHQPPYSCVRQDIVENIERKEKQHDRANLLLIFFAIAKSWVIVKKGMLFQYFFFSEASRRYVS